MLPPELQRAFLTDKAPSGRPMKRRRLQHHERQDRAPITDLPKWESALVWRRKDSGPRVRAFVRVAKEVLG